MHDLRYALRQLTARPGFSSTIVLTLALGIGLNALTFSAVHSVLLRPLPFPGPDRLIMIWETQPGVPTRAVAPANFLDWRSATSVEALAAYAPRRRSLVAGEPQRIDTAAVSANFFDVLRVEPLTGRTFSASIAAGGTREALIREDLWIRQFGADRSIVGRALRLDDETLVIAGVIPAAQAFPEDAVVWTQAPFDVPELRGAPGDIRAVRDAWYLRVIGRLRPSIARQEAQAEFDTIAARLRERHPSTNRNNGVRLVDLQSEITGASASILWMLFAVAGCVLVVACANVATLLLAGAIGRRRELTIRAALGATRIRLVRQLTMESVMLALSGGALGLALARAARPALIALLPSGTPRTASIAVDPAVAWFALGLSVLTAVLFGMAPALIAAPRRLSADLKSGVRAAGSRSGARWSSALVIAQLATVLVLVAGAGLMLRTLWMLQQRETGIDVARLLALDVTLPDARARGRSAAVGDIERMIGRLEALPGVESAAAVQTLPLAGRGPSANIRVEGRAFPAGEAPDVVWKPITPDYFRTVGTRIVRGRAFTDADRDGAAPVAIVNARLAELLWPDGDPIGARIGTGLDGNGAPLTVVGVVSDAQQEGIGADVLPEMYRPLAQPARFGVDAMSLVLRTAGDPTALAAAARQAVRDVHPLAPIPAVRPLQAIVDAGLASESTALRALGAFGGLALVLAAVGLYGVMARLVGDRARDLGIRMALGAEPRAVRWLVLRRSLSLCAVALAMGVLLSMAVSRQLGALLHGAAPVDPLVLSGASLVLVLAALAASYLPARRASRIDPLLVLKQE